MVAEVVMELFEDGVRVDMVGVDALVPEVEGIVELVDVAVCANMGVAHAKKHATRASREWRSIMAGRRPIGYKVNEKSLQRIFGTFVLLQRDPSRVCHSTTVCSAICTRGELMRMMPGSPADNTVACSRFQSIWLAHALSLTRIATWHFHKPDSAEIRAAEVPSSSPDFRPNPCHVQMRDLTLF